MSFKAEEVKDLETDLNTLTTNLQTDSENEKSLKEPPRPRLCHLKKWPHFQGYGFNLHAERAKTGQHIGKVDIDSPAESAGLREGDRIIEVNNVNISNENHQQVVKRIRNGLEKNGKFCDDEVLLLVLDHEADVYYRDLNIIVKSDFKNILKITTQKPIKDNNDENNNENTFTDQNTVPTIPQPNKATFNDSTNTANNVANDLTNKLANNSLSSISQKSVNSNDSLVKHTENIAESTTNQCLNNLSTTSLMNKSTHKDPGSSSTSNLSVSSNNQSNSSKATTPNIPKRNEADNKQQQQQETPVNIYDQNSIDRRTKVDPFQMSAAEFKTYLKSKGRQDPRIAQVDMRQKFQMFQDM